MKHLKILSFSILCIVMLSCKVKQTPSKVLTSSQYKIVKLEDREVSNFNLTLKINAEDQRISGYSGCNNYSFNYQLENEVLDFGFGVSSKMYCEKTQFIEDAFFETMSKVKRFEQTNSSLKLLSKSGELILKAVKVDTK